jgi:hypothetical protein
MDYKAFCMLQPEAGNVKEAHRLDYLWQKVLINQSNFKFSHRRHLQYVWNCWPELVSEDVEGKLSIV